MTGNCVPAREGGEQPAPRRTVRNESKAHQMSLENPQSVKPSLLECGEGCQDWTKANPAMSGRGLNGGLSSHHNGVVRGRGRFVEVRVLMDEISADGRHGPTAGTSGASREARLVRGEVGMVHSSDEAANHRGAKEPCLVEVNSAAEDRS